MTLAHWLIFWAVYLPIDVFLSVVICLSWDVQRELR